MQDNRDLDLCKKIGNCEDQYMKNLFPVTTSLCFCRFYETGHKGNFHCRRIHYGIQDVSEDVGGTSVPLRIFGPSGRSTLWQPMTTALHHPKCTMGIYTAYSARCTWPRMSTLSRQRQPVCSPPPARAPGYCTVGCPWSRSAPRWCYIGEPWPHYTSSHSASRHQAHQA